MLTFGLLWRDRHAGHTLGLPPRLCDLLAVILEQEYWDLPRTARPDRTQEFGIRMREVLGTVDHSRFGFVDELTGPADNRRSTRNGPHVFALFSRRCCLPLERLKPVERRVALGLELTAELRLDLGQRDGLEDLWVGPLNADESSRL